MPTWFRASDGDDSQGRDVLKKHSLKPVFLKSNIENSKEKKHTSRVSNV